MRITIEPTPELYKTPNGTTTRVWRGQLDGMPNKCTVYVYAVTPDKGHEKLFELNRPDYMKPTRDMPGYVKPEDMT